jgi:hypothetical protein
MGRFLDLVDLHMLFKLIFTFTLLSSSVFATDAPKPTADALSRWVGGKWVGDGKLVDSDYSKAMAVSGVTNCAWSPNHTFVVCDQAITADGKPDRALSIYAFDPDKAAYHMFGMSPSGERPRVTELNITPDHNRWEYLGKAEIKGKPVEFRTVNVFRDDNHVDWWSEYSIDDGAHWVRTGEGKESRQK